MIWLYDHPAAVIAGVVVLSLGLMALAMCAAASFGDAGGITDNGWPHVEPGYGQRHVRLVYSRVPTDWATDPDYEYLTDTDDESA